MSSIKSISANTTKTNSRVLLPHDQLESISTHNQIFPHSLNDIIVLESQLRNRTGRLINGLFV